MNNEPVAWMLNGIIHECDPSDWAKDNVLKDVIPLYTHPVKEQDESFDRTASHMAGEYVSGLLALLAVKELQAILFILLPQLKQLTDEEI